METDSMRFSWIACNWRQDNPKEKKNCLSHGRKTLVIGNRAIFS